MADYGNSTACHQDPADTNQIVEGTAVMRVQVGGRNYTVLGGAWYTRVTTGAAGERFYGLAATEPDPSHEFAAWHHGIRKALPDLGDEGEPVAMVMDDPLTHIGASVPGRLVVWDPAVNSADELVGFLERPVEVDDLSIRVRIGIR